MDGEKSRKEDALISRYVRILRAFLWTLGGWPGQYLGEKEPFIIKCHRTWLPFQAFILAYGQIMYIWKYFKLMDFYLTGYCYLTLSLTYMTAFRTSFFSRRTYKRIIKTFLMCFHLLHHKHKGKYYRQVCIKMERVSYFFTVYMMAMMIVGMSLFNIIPLYKNYSNGFSPDNNTKHATLDFVLYLYFPGIIEATQYFVPLTIYNIYCTFPCSSSVCSLDLLVTLMVFQITGHVQILKKNINSIPKPQKHTMVTVLNEDRILETVAVEMYDAEENQYICEKLVECISHYKMIVNFTNELSAVFGPALGLNYVFHLTSCCILLLELSSGDIKALVQFGPLTAIIFGQLIQISVIFEIIDTASSTLDDCVYSIPWQSMDLKNRRTIMMLIQRLKRPLCVQALGSIRVGVTTMVQILKATLSYYTLLRSLNQ